MEEDLSDAPVPDVVRVARLSLGRIAPAQVELFGAPGGVLSVARWLRRAADLHPEVERPVAVAGPRRDAVIDPLSALVVRVASSSMPAVTVEGDALVLTGDAFALGALADAFEVVGVGALDLRWAPVERRRLLRPGPDVGPDDEEPALRAGSVELIIAAAYPLEGDGEAIGS